MFAPTEVDGRILGDGGLVDNLPVDVARAMGIARVHVLDPTLNPEAFEALVKSCLDSGELALIIARRSCLLASSAIRQYEKLNELEPCK